MKYEKIVDAKFISRSNRFVAVVELNGEATSVYVKIQANLTLHITIPMALIGNRYMIMVNPKVT